MAYYTVYRYIYKKFNMVKKFIKKKTFKSENFIYFRLIYMLSKTLKKELTANESQKSVSRNIIIFTFEFG